MKNYLNIYIGCPEDDLSGNYLCLDISLTNGSEISVEQSVHIGSLSEDNFLTLLEGTFNRANYISKELRLPVVVDTDAIVIACVDENFGESTINEVKALIAELRRQIKQGEKS